MLTGGTTPICGYCGRPVLAHSVFSGGAFFHLECTQSPNQTTYQPIPPTEDRIRQIIREELARAAPPA